MKVIKHAKDVVLIQDGRRNAWVDVWVENGDVICDWNKSLFIMTDDDDVKLKNWQYNLDNFEEAIDSHTNIKRW